MKIFLSYSSTNRTKAEEIALALQTQGHEVFFDKDDLSGGEDFNAVIRTRIANADLFVFLISPDFVRQGAYSLSELRLARENHFRRTLYNPECAIFQGGLIKARKQ